MIVKCEIERAQLIEARQGAASSSHEEGSVFACLFLKTDFIWHFFFLVFVLFRTATAAC